MRYLFLILFCFSAHANTVVSGFTESDIESAAAIEGAGGTVIFPAGTYTVDSLTVDYADQTWKLHPYATIKRSDTTPDPGIEVFANGFRLRGGTIDGNNPNNPSRPGVLSDGHSVDIRGTTIKDAGSWGLHIKDAALTLIDSSVKHSLNGAVLWSINDSTNRPGPYIERLKVARWDPNRYSSHGGVHIRSNGDGWVFNPVVKDSVVKLVQGNNYAAVGVECIQCQDFVFTNNRVEFGRIGFSAGNGRYGKMIGNHAQKSWDYLYEIAQGTLYTLVNSNTGVGGGGVGYGVEISNSNYNTVTDNNLPLANPVVRDAGTGNHVSNNH